MSITQSDIDFLVKARLYAASGSRFADLSDEERATYVRIHEALEALAQRAVDELGGQGVVIRVKHRNE